jgi:Zn-dependent membrane protease YugP
MSPNMLQHDEKHPSSYCIVLWFAFRPAVIPAAKLVALLHYSLLFLGFLNQHSLFLFGIALLRKLAIAHI